MNNKDDFYIGWQANAPVSFAKKVKQFVIALAVLVPILAFTLVSQQRGFSSSNFEFGELTTIQGILSLEPVPMLKVQNGRDAFGNHIVQTILLVGFGKFGATETLQKIERRGDVWTSLNNRRIKLNGTLIYKEGKILLELTEGTNSIVEVSTSSSIEPKKNEYGQISLKGEIMDAKCHFGVMKPGEGKPHRSCAIRCIAGGIPPVLKTSNEAGENNYFILLDSEGKMLQQQVLDYVGEPIALCGRLEKLDDWYYIYVDLEKGFERLGNGLMKDIPMCNG